MLVLKYILLTILFAVISYLAAELIVTAIMLEWVYPYALSFSVAYLQDKGHGFYLEPNIRAQGFNIIIRVIANLIFYVVGMVLIIVLVPYGAIKLGCMLGWYTSAFFTVYYEFCNIPVIGRLDHIEHDTESDIDVAHFVDVEGEGYQFPLNDWDPEDYPQQNERYVVMGVLNYWAFMPLRLD